MRLNFHCLTGSGYISLYQELLFFYRRKKNNYISLDYAKRTVKSYSLQGTELEEEIPDIPDQEPLAALWACFRDSLDRNGRGNVGPEAARSALELALRISHSIEEKSSHRIPD